MPYYQNALYGQGAPTYANVVSPLADVFKALAPNPVRDLQIAGYMNKSHLDQMRGQQIDQELAGYNEAANQLAQGNRKGAYVAGLRTGQGQFLNALPRTMAGEFAAEGVDDPAMLNSPGYQDRLATLNQGAGGDYAHSQPGFTSHETRLGQEAADKNAEYARGHTLTYDAAMAGHGVTREVGLDRNARYTEVGHYKADHPAPGKGGAGKPPNIDPVKVDQVFIRALPNSFQDTKGRWNEDPSITPEAKAAARQAVAEEIGADPTDVYGAVNRGIGRVFGNAPQITEAVPPTPDTTHFWETSNAKPGVPSKVVALPPDQRLPLSKKAVSPVVAAAAGVPPTPTAPNTTGGTAPSPAADVNLMKAAAAVKGGGNRAGIVKHLMDNGYSAQQIQQAGI